MATIAAVLSEIARAVASGDGIYELGSTSMRTCTKPSIITVLAVETAVIASMMISLRASDRLSAMTAFSAARSAFVTQTTDVVPASRPRNSVTRRCRSER